MAVVMLGAATFTSPTASAAQKQQAEVMDCDITMKGDFNGTIVDIVITVYDVSRFECGALRLAVRLASPKK